MVTTGKTVLYSSAGKRLPFAWPGWKLPVEVRSARPGGDLLVRIAGAIEVYGLTKLGDLGVLVCREGPLGEQYYAGRGNMLRPASPVSSGEVIVTGTVRVRIKPYGRDVPYARQFRGIRFKAPIAVSRLCTAVPPARHADTNEDPHVMSPLGEVKPEDFPDRAPLIRLLAAPKGKPLFTRAANKWGYSLVRIDKKDGWDRVAAGSGPYLLGWIPSRPDYRPGAGGFGIGGVMGSMGKGKGPMSLRTKGLKQLPLHHLSAGTEVQQFGVVHGRLKKPGFARASSRQGKWIYVTAAVDEEMVVEGWIEARRLGAKVAE